MAREILVAYDVLRDPAKRADYHNATDYDGGWLSWSRWKSIFWAECANEEQLWSYRKRLGLALLSFLFFAGGIAVTALSAGLASPISVAVGAALGGGLIGGGTQSGFRTVKKKAVEGGVDVKDWAKSGAIGFVAGAAAGGFASGAAAAFAGIGQGASEAVQITMGGYIGMNAAAGAPAGAVYSLGSDFEKWAVDGEKMTWKQVVGHAACGAIAGCGTGVVGGAVTKAVVSRTVAATAAKLKLDAAEKITVRTAGKQFEQLIARKVSRGLAEGCTEVLFDSATSFLEERLDNEV